MILGICGPVDTRPLAQYLDAGGPGMPAGLGGTPVVALVRAAIEAGRRVIVFSLDPSIAEERIATGPRLKICMGPFRRRHRSRDLFRAERRYLAEAIARERPDTVHTHWTYEFALGALASGVPAVVTAHDCPLRILRWDRSPYRIVRALMAGIVARRARRLTAVSEAVAEHFRRYFHWRGVLPVIPNAIEPEWFEGVGCPPPGPGFLFAGVLDGWGTLKNGRALLGAFAMARRSLPGAHLLLFGHGHGPGEEAEAWARRRDLAAGVQFLGHVTSSELRERIRHTGALVHPSREESFSMVVAEAMAGGIPVVAARGSGSVAETLEGGRWALLVDCSSPEALARGMLRLARDPALRTRLADGARAAAARELSLPRVWEAYNHVYAAAEEN